MLVVQQLTTNPRQKQNLVLPDGTAFELTIYFRPIQQGWFIEQLVYGDFVLNGMRISNSPNMLNQWLHVVPFGLACYSVNNREPSQQGDFFSGASTLYVLSQAEALEVAGYLELG